MASIERTDLEDAFAVALSSNVIEYATQTSAALQAFPTLPMGTATYRQPVLAALPTGGFLSADQDVKPSSKAIWDGVLMTAEEVAVIVPVSESAIADANFDVTSAVERLIGQEFARILDAAVFFGTGAPASWPTGGIYQAAIGASPAQKTEYVANIADSYNALYGLVEEVSDVTHVFSSKSVRSMLRGLKDTNGVPIYVPTMGTANVSAIYGIENRYPLGWDKTKALSLAVDSASVALGMRQDLTIKILDQATITGFGNLAEKDSIAIRAVMRPAFQIANPVSLDAGARKYPFAAIVNES